MIQAKINTLIVNQEIKVKKIFEKIISRVKKNIAVLLKFKKSNNLFDIKIKINDSKITKFLSKKVFSSNKMVDNLKFIFRQNPNYQTKYFLILLLNIL